MIWVITVVYLLPPVWAHWREVGQRMDLWFACGMMVWLAWVGQGLEWFTALGAVKMWLWAFSAMVEAPIFVIVWSDV